MNVNLEALDNKYVSAVLTIFLILYAGLARPELPSFIENLFKNQAFRVVILALIAYQANRDPALALMIALAFTITINYLAEREMKTAVEKFTVVKRS